MKQDKLRPDTLEEYVGQDQLKEPLEAAIASAKQRKAPLPHVLLSGPPGLGKTTLALIIAHEMGWELLDLIGSTAGNPIGLAKKLLTMQPNTMLFIDEIHALRKPVQEVLYPVLEDNRLLYRRGSASGEFPLPPLTVLGATTDLGKLAQPFIDRFQLAFELRFYEPDELVELGKATAIRLGMGILADDILEPIADRSRGTPRYMNKYLQWIRDFKIFESVDHVDAEYVKYVLWQKLKVDSLGLRGLDRNYLRVLAEGTGPIGIDQIASRLQQAEVTLARTVEPYLLYAGLVNRISTGRIITGKGRDHLNSLMRKKVVA